MAGTFREGDRLEIKKNKMDEIKPGDLAVFVITNGKEKETRCVHRVIAVAKKGLTTRGDNNPKSDEELVTEKFFLGKVIHYERNGKIHKVWNGKLGLIKARLLHERLHVIRTTKFFFRKPYRMLKKTNLVTKLWHPEIEMIRFETQDGPLVKYVHNSKTVASCWVNDNCWRFRRPYDFIIGPKSKKTTGSS